MEIVCTKCGSDNVQRLEVIFDHGTSDVNTSSKTVWVGIGGGGLGIGGAKTKTSGTSQSVMAQKAAPPLKKKMVFWVVMVLVGIMMTTGFQSGSMGMGFGGVALLALGGYMIYTVVLYNKNEYTALYQTWLNAWMCNKCGEVFVIE